MENMEQTIDPEIEEMLNRKTELVEDRLRSLALKLGTKFDEQEKRKSNDVNPRMLEAYRDYHGKYSPEEEKRFDSAEHQGSRAFANICRPKTKSFIAKISDILYPTDETNFALKASSFNRDMADAEIRAGKMQATIKEQLEMANDASVARDQIRDGSIYGAGIIKGPILTNKVIKAWMDMGEGVQVQQVVESKRPDLQRVRPWNFFPDMNACRLEDAEFVFERQYLSRRELQDLAKLPGIIKSQISEVLKIQPTDEQGDDLERDIRQQVSELEQRSGAKKYVLIMYHGPVSVEDIANSGEYSHGEIQDMPDEVMGEVWLIGEYVVKMILNPMESGDFPYSVWSPEEDDQCIFGYGIPHLLKHPQKIRNSSLRMMLDNAGMSVGPQVVIDKKAIYPADGSWKRTPNKTWIKKTTDVPIGNVFEVYNIPNNQADLSALYKMSREQADEETNMPLASQPNEAGNVMASKTGVMSMVMNSQNVTLRESVKSFDDNRTVPTIKRFYDWNMQFNNDPEIKCDCIVTAKGSSELLLKETQAANVGNLMSVATADPFAPQTDFTKLYDQIIRTLQFDPDKIKKSESQQKEEAKQSKPPNPAEMEMQLKQAEIQLAQQKLEQANAHHQDKMQQQTETRKQKYELAELELQKVVGTLAVQKEISVENAAAKLQGVHLQIAGKRQLMADETKVKMAFGTGL